MTTENLSHNTLKSLWNNGNAKALDFLSSLDFEEDYLEYISRNVSMRNPFNNPRKFDNLTDEVLYHEMQDPNHYQYFPIAAKTSNTCPEAREIVNSEYLDNSNSENIEEIERIQETNTNPDNESFLNSEISATVTNEIRRQDEKHPNSYIHEGKLIYKSNAISSMIHNLTNLHQSNISTNTDRTTRVYHQSLYANVEDENELPRTLGQIMSPDYLATFIINKLDKTISLIFISINKITIGTQLVNSISHEDIHKAKFNGMVIDLTQIDKKHIFSDTSGQYIGTELRGVLGTIVYPIKFETTLIDNKKISKSKFELIDMKQLL